VSRTQTVPYSERRSSLSLLQRSAGTRQKTAWLPCIRLLSVFSFNVENCRLNGQNVSWKLVNTMSLSKYDAAADLHIYAAHAHTAAAAAHHRGDHEAAEELSSKAQDYSMAASEKTLEIAKHILAPLRA
jgi:hypothetical protein